MSNYKVGDVLVHVFSYNMTFVKFYQVVEVSKTGKTMKFARIDDRIVEGNGMFGKVVARPDEFIESTDNLKTVRTSRSPAIWNGEPMYFNTID